ncbi:hypothetical protein HCA69_00770 [Listeria grandensis]|uniref:Uncharacterized protein n=1 Tax=Listeria grandensis TaxID=1494963 RepID=A0A7X0Y0P9_9LIST|nr:DUF6731 family protein [Listeria grandensis]MBC1934876.1 hypothetical protein [Listeria grandensis]
MEKEIEIEHVEKKVKKRIRTVNFEFYRVCALEEDGSEVYYDLFGLLDYIKEKDLSKRSIGYSGETARLDSIYLEEVRPYKLFQMHFCRLRDDVPAKANILSDELEDINLDENEYVAEDINLLYDNDLNILMVQRNMHSLSPSGVEFYLNSFLDKMIADNKMTIYLKPIIDTQAIKKSKKSETFRKLTLRTDNGSLNKLIQGPYAKAFDDLKDLGGTTIEIIISSRSKKSKLNKDEVLRIIETIENDKEAFSKAELTGKRTEGSKIEKFDLLRGKYKVSREYNIPAKMFLNPTTVFSDITPLYKASIRSELQLLISQ